MRKMTILFAASEADVQRANADGYEAATSRENAERLAPWAAALVEVGGPAWVAYESVEDARIAQQQV